MGEHDVRLVEDGCYYCLECREACDYVPENKGAAQRGLGARKTSDAAGDMARGICYA